MITARPVPAESAAVLDEHRSIRAAIEALRVHLRVPSPSARAAWLARLDDDLGGLAALLRPHFEREEGEAGLFVAIEAAQPEFVNECARLRAQHGSLLEGLAAVERKIRARRHDARSVEGLRSAIRALLSDLSHHEASENALLLSAIEGQEVGTLD
jgi:hypothetical protein